MTNLDSLLKRSDITLPTKVHLVNGLDAGKDPDAEKDWRWEEKGTTEDEMVGWHHLLDGHEFE